MMYVCIILPVSYSVDCSICTTSAIPILYVILLWIHFLISLCVQLFAAPPKCACAIAFYLAHSINLAQNAIGHSIQFNKYLKHNRWKEMIRCASNDTYVIANWIIASSLLLTFAASHQSFVCVTKYGYERAVPLQSGLKDFVPAINIQHWSQPQIQSSPVQSNPMRK